MSIYLYSIYRLSTNVWIELCSRYAGKKNIAFHRYIFLSFEWKICYQSHYNFSENRVTDGRELEGLEAVKLNEGTKDLIIAVKGYQNGNPDPGKTQTKFYEKDSFVASLLNTFGHRDATQAAVFDGSMNSRTRKDILSSIKEFRKVSPNGKLILVGHSMGADNIVNASNENSDLKIDKVITMDISDPLVKADNELSANVVSADNYYQNNIISFGGTEIERKEGNNKTIINNKPIPNTTHTQIDNNNEVKKQIIKDVKNVLAQ